MTSLPKPWSTWVARIRNALPVALISAAYAFYVLSGRSLLGLDGWWLSRLYMLEFLAIHSYPFMMVVLLWKPSSDKFRGLRLVLVVLLASFYILAASSMAGGAGVLAFGTLMAGTYLGLLLKTPNRSLIPEIVIRGAGNFFLFIFCSLVFGLPEDVDEWAGDRDTLTAGLVYFAILAALEVRGTYERISSRVPSAMTTKEADTGGGEYQIPISAKGVRAAVVPLLASVGVALAPYLVLPVIAGIVGRQIDQMVDWPTGSDLIRVWYFVLYVASLSLVRSWQLRLVLTKEGMKSYPRIRLVLWGVFALAGYGSFFSGYSLTVDPMWTLDDAVWVVIVDFLLLCVLVPVVWMKVGGMPRDGKTEVR